MRHTISLSRRQRAGALRASICVSMRFTQRVAQWIILLLLMLQAGFVAAQQGYPNKPIRIITPYAPGGATTVLGRLVGDKLTQAWGQQVLLDNRPGGNTVIGSEAMVRSAADGYTLLLITSTHVINSVLLPNLPYDAAKDFAAVATLAGYEPVLLIHPSVPANTLQEFIALARSRPGQLNYATAGGNGSATHLTGEFFNMLTGVRINQVPYKGTGPVLTALMAGEVQMHITPPAIFIPAIKAGKIKALAVGGDTRLSSLPQVPTFAEGGLPAYQLKGWYGVLAPAATPKPIIDKVSAEIGRILNTPDIRDKLVNQEMEPFINTADQFSALIKSEIAKFDKIVKTANIKPGE
jgi:tripartite-type tricarboxylate transporter receptor subunit TctC